MALKFIDIGANLTDKMFNGIYNGSKKHAGDIESVLKRAWNGGMKKMIITVGSLDDVDDALALAKTDERLFVTIGCHPTQCRQFDKNPDEYLSKLSKCIEQNMDKVIAIGECGLDYKRTEFCEINIQKKYFEMQLSLAEKFQLPLFLHCRESHSDLVEILRNNRDKCRRGGIVHSFDGTIEEAKQIINLGFYIGLNGCSLKTEQNLETIKALPPEIIMIETDSPWCGIKPSHAGFKYVQTMFSAIKKKERWSPDMLINGRNEPCQIIQVLEVIAGVRDTPVEELADIIYTNTRDFFDFMD